MDENLHTYARIGLVHHMLYPECMDDPEVHVQSLEAFVKRDDIETLDCCLPYGHERRARLIPQIRDSGKSDITFATHLFPLRKLAFTTPAPHEQSQVRMIVADMVQQAAAIGATGFIFASGGPAPSDATEAHYKAFADFCTWLCNELKYHGITAMLEPFDTTIDKKYLYGPTDACVALIESLRSEVDNLGIELDLAHVPLMGESFEHAIKTVAPYLKRIHLGNSVIRDSNHPRYGDTHPPIGYPGGEIDVAEVAEILHWLLEVGYLNPHNRGNLVIEMTPWPGLSVDDTVSDSIRRLEEAWRQV